MAERLSLHDETLLASHADHIQRYEFALPHCRGKRVLDAGCGTGYGSAYLASHGAASVLAIDISAEALDEARSNYAGTGVRFQQADVEELRDLPQEEVEIDVIVNFENLEHLRSADAFLAGAEAILSRNSGTLIVSTPNGAVAELNGNGKPRNPHHVKEYTRSELMTMLQPRFSNVQLFGQWLTFDGRLRRLRAREQFDRLCELYYGPISRFDRTIRRLLGRRVLAPPNYTGSSDSYSGDYLIEPITSNSHPWAPTVLIAVCSFDR